MGRKELQLSWDRDLPLLKYLWQWKASTTATIAAKFFRNTTFYATYKRLHRLEKGGFIISVCSPSGVGFVWMLNLKGFKCIKPYLPELKENGFKSEHLGHDIVVSAVHQGEWLWSKPSGIEVIAEQELRRYDKKDYPSWVPRTSIRRPDGYWRIDDGNTKKTVALEVELHQKKLDEYGSISDFYHLDAQCAEVIWVVDYGYCWERIYERLTKNKATSVIHNFIHLHDFGTQGWQARIQFGKNAGKSLKEILVPSLGQPSDQSYMDVLFDFRKKPINSVPHSTMWNQLFFKLYREYPAPIWQLN